MAHLHLRNYNTNRSGSFLESIGQKLKKTGAQIAGSIKQIYDITKELAPIVTAAAAVIL